MPSSKIQLINVQIEMDGKIEHLLTWEIFIFSGRYEGKWCISVHCEHSKRDAVMNKIKEHGLEQYKYKYNLTKRFRGKKNYWKKI